MKSHSLSNLHYTIFNNIHMDVSSEVIYTIDNLPDLEKSNISKLFISISIQCLQQVLISLTPLLKILESKPMVQVILLPNEPLDALQHKCSYQSVAMGGTFDYFHIGHQILLLQALTCAKKQLVIGVSGPSLLKNKKNKMCIEPIQNRMREVRKYVDKIRPDLKLHLEEINDPFGPAIVLPQLEAIVVSEETLKGGQKINQIRSEKGLQALQIVVAPILSLDGDKQTSIMHKLSSSAIRSYILQKNKMTEVHFGRYHKYWLQLISFMASFLGKQPSQFADLGEKWWKIVITKYSEYWRFYHTNFHIFSMLNSLQNSFKDKKCPNLLISIWFHDIQYKPSRMDNQQKSAEIAGKFVSEFGIQAGVENYNKVDMLIEDVRKGIMATKKHGRDEVDVGIKILIDLDMGILNEKLEIYQGYMKEIEKQYSPLVGKQNYCLKRGEFLKSLKPHEVFYFQDNIQPMKKNIIFQLQSLQKSDI